MKTKTEMKWVLAVLLMTALSTTAISQGEPASIAGEATLVVNARNDKPGPVDIRVQGWDVHDGPTIDIVLSWSLNDNGFSEITIDIPKKTRILRFTFVNDYYVPPWTPDYDRNAYIDYFKVNNLRYEAEEWDRTGGPDPLYPGAEVDIVDGRTVADCGNQGDYVEYDLHPGNPVGPGIGPGRRIGPKP